MSSTDRTILAVGPCFAGPAAAARFERDLAREGLHLLRADSQDLAALRICEARPLVVIIHLGLVDGSPLAVADFCNYRRPDVPLILLASGDLVTDGSLFRHVGNARSIVPPDMGLPDLAALVAHHAAAACH